MAKFDALPILTAGHLVFDRETLFKSITPKLNRTRWYMELGIGTLFETDFEYSGHVVQLNLARTSGKKQNWSLGAQFGYHYRNVNQFLNFAPPPEAENMDGSNTTNTDFTSRASQGSTDTTTIFRTHHVVLGLSVGRRIKGNLWLGGGLEGGYLLTHGWGPASSLDELDASFSTSGPGTYSPLRPEQLDLNRFDLALVTNLNYAFAPRWKAQIGYRHGFINQFSSDNNKAYRRYFDIGLNWRLK